MVEMSKKNEFTRLFRNGGHPLPSVAVPYLKRTVTSVGIIVEFSGLGLIWDNIPEFVSRDWGKPRRTRVYVVCWSRFAPSTSRIGSRRSFYPTAACDYLCLGIRTYFCVSVPILLRFGSLSFKYVPFNYRRV